jgi:hypothetical protein
MKVRFHHRTRVMPFTPLHMGPGAAIKAVMQSRFSLMVFGWSQVVIDLQPLYAMLGGDVALHGVSHTLAGATLIALFCGATGKWLGEFGLRILREPEHLPISMRVSFASAFIGTYSHILIDSIMHGDVLPLAPFSKATLYNIISIDALHVACVVSGVVGAAGFYLVKRQR